VTSRCPHVAVIAVQPWPGRWDVQVEFKEWDMPKGRVIFLLRIKPGMQEAFLQGYELIRHDVAQGVKGHLVDQVCQSPDDPESWVITSEWESLEQFLAVE